MTRIRAFLIHLAISLVAFLVLLYLVTFQWYPGFLFAADGGLQGIRLVAGVVLILGPFLTLLLFKPGKWGLKFDMWVIAIIQVAVFGWGTWTLYKERPYAIIFAENFFKPLTHEQILHSGASSETINTICVKQPCLIFSNLPEKLELLQKARARAFQKRGAIQLLGEYYDSFSARHVERLKQASLNVSKIIGKNIDDDIRKQFISYQQQSDKYRFFRISCRYRQLTAVFDTETFKIVDTIDYAPPVS